ncbi:MAG: gamma-glutamyl-gamma-aminobutyrate hydrolase family protein [Bradymonadales bacterium]|nr:gamma-glutamyl-gamma-aminobutyrate hydrolase family protein [Bradymonadales bacterium]
MTHLLVIDNALDRELFQPVVHWGRLAPPGVAVTGIHAPSQPLPADLSPYGHVIVSGSEASICHRDGWAEQEAAWLRWVMESGVPVLASCWGHQLVAYAWGGAEYIGRAAEPELGWLEVEVTDPTDPLLGPEGGRMFAFNSHFDEVCKVPPGFVVTARSAGCAVQAMRHQSLPVFGLQSHPEVRPEEGRFFLETLASRNDAIRERIERALQGECRDSGAAGRLVSRFLG